MSPPSAAGPGVPLLHGQWPVAAPAQLQPALAEPVGVRGLQARGQGELKVGAPSQRGVAGPSVTGAGLWALGVWGAGPWWELCTPCFLGRGDACSPLALDQGPGIWRPSPWVFLFVLGVPRSHGKEDGGGTSWSIPCPRVPVCTQSSPADQLLSLYIIYTVGYALSFTALVIASAILLGFR